MKILLWLIAILVVFAAVTVWKAGRNEAATRESHPPLGAFVDVDGTRLHYVQMGDGPDVVLIHGASGNVRDFTFDLAGALANRYRVTVFDRPGLGYSDRLGPGGATIFAQADVLAEASAQLGLTAPVVLGHSYGGAVALAWATGDTTLPPSALVLVAAASNTWDSPMSLYYRVLSHPWLGPLAIPVLTAWVPKQVVTDTIGEVFAPQSTPEGYSDYIGAGLTLQRSVLRENALQRAGILDEITEMVPRYDSLSLPVEILHGDADTTVWLSIHSEPLSRQIEGSNLVAMEGVGHAPHHAHRATIEDAVDRAVAEAGLR